MGSVSVGTFLTSFVIRSRLGAVPQPIGLGQCDSINSYFDGGWKITNGNKQ